MRWLVIGVVAAIGCSKAREPGPIGEQVPGDTALLATLSIERLRASEHWPKLESALAAKLPLALVQRTCATDPVRAIQSITLALPADAPTDRALVLVRGVPRDIADSCVKSFAAAQQMMITISDEGGLAAYREGDEAMYAAWLDARTVAFAPGDLLAKERLLALAKPAQRDPAFADALAQFRKDRTFAVAFAAPAQSQLASIIAQSGLEVQSGHGWIELGTTLRAELTGRFATVEAAAAAAKQTFQGPLAKLKATHRDREVVFALELDAAETAQVVDQVLSLAR
ncbi:MAG TPA: hypothetical protein VIV11_29855 [Kofleriaceae bacterium]